MQSCPYCNEKIKSDAVKCKYCKEWTDKKRVVPASQLNECVFCKERIHEDAIKCKYCKEFISEYNDGKQTSSSPTAFQIIITIIFSAVVLALLVAAFIQAQNFFLARLDETENVNNQDRSN